MLKFGGEEALEIVLDDENAKKIRIAAGAEDVPGKRGEAKTGDGDGVKPAEGVAPAVGDCCPQENGSAGENDGHGTFGESGEAKEHTKEEGGKGG